MAETLNIFSIDLIKIKWVSDTEKNSLNTNCITHNHTCKIWSPTFNLPSLSATLPGLIVLIKIPWAYNTIMTTKHFNRWQITGQEHLNTKVISFTHIWIKCWCSNQTKAKSAWTFIKLHGKLLTLVSGNIKGKKLKS